MKLDTRRSSCLPRLTGLGFPVSSFQSRLLSLQYRSRLNAVHHPEGNERREQCQQYSTQHDGGKRPGSDPQVHAEQAATEITSDEYPQDHSRQATRESQSGNLTQEQLHYSPIARAQRLHHGDVFATIEDNGDDRGHNTEPYDNHD